MKKFFYLFVMAIGMASCNGDNGASGNFITLDGKTYNVKYAYKEAGGPGGEGIYLTSIPLEEVYDDIIGKDYTYFAMYYDSKGTYYSEFVHKLKNGEKYIVDCPIPTPSKFEITDNKMILDIKDMEVEYEYVTAYTKESKKSKMSVHFSGSYTTLPDL